MIHIIAAIYITIKFNQLRGSSDGNSSTCSSTGRAFSSPSSFSSPRPPRPTPPSRLQTACNIICYDPFVAIYIFVTIAAFSWLQIGISRLKSGAGSIMMNCAIHADHTSSTTLSLVEASISLDSAFYSMAILSLCCSMCYLYFSTWCRCCCCGCCRCCSCCGCCDDDDDDDDDYNDEERRGEQQNLYHTRTFTQQGARRKNNDAEYLAPASASPAASPIIATPVNYEAIPATVVDDNDNDDGGDDDYYDINPIPVPKELH